MMNEKSKKNKASVEQQLSEIRRMILIGYIMMGAWVFLLFSYGG
jgi:hypothetical protein